MICDVLGTRNVSWTANYDLHAITEAGQPTASVNLHYRARIYQSTGEDWKDTTLTLSTATADSYSKGLPALKLLRITPVDAQQKAHCEEAFSLSSSFISHTIFQTLPITTLVDYLGNRQHTTPSSEEVQMVLPRCRRRPHLVQLQEEACSDLS